MKVIPIMSKVVTNDKQNDLENGKFIQPSIKPSKLSIKIMMLLFPLYICICICMTAIVLFLVNIIQANSSTTNTVPSVSTNPNALNIVLFGDSLINVPYTYYNLGGLLSNKLTTFYHDINVFNQGNDGQKIAEIALRVDDVLALKPHAVILQWDSDISDTVFGLLNDDEISELHTTYANTLRSVIGKLQNHSVEFVAVSGPILLGEGRVGLPPSEFSDTNPLDTYRDINQDVCEEMNATYIDMRQRFLDHLPSYWIATQCFLTTDGEHPNRRGTRLIADGFTEALQGWLIKRESH